MVPLTAYTLTVPSEIRAVIEGRVFIVRTDGGVNVKFGKPVEDPILCQAMRASDKRAEA